MLNKNIVFSAVFAAIAMIAATSVATAGTIDFESLAHGEIVNTQFQGSDGVTISAVNFNKPHDLAIAFDTQETGTADPDLEGPPWDFGNLAPNTVLGTILIIASDDTQTESGIVDDPNDEGNRPAGTLTFVYDTPVISFGMDVVDVESITAELGFITFFLGNTELGQVGFDDFTDDTSSFYDPTIVYGNNSANRIAPITLGQLNLGPATFDKVVITLGGSGGIDNVVTVVPEPTTMGLFALASVALLRRRRAA